jgi:hypothetical protein
MIGFKGKNQPTCLTHSLGVWDKRGTAHFVLQAPVEKGVYELRFNYEQAGLCSDAAKVWKHDTPSARATVGVVIVE